MSLPIRAITLDLDDTLWPIAPVIARAERALHDWFARRAPGVLERHTIESMRALRDAVAAEFPELSHDYTAQRRIALERLLREADEDVTLAEEAFETFFAACCEVEHYEDTVEALERLSARVPLAALSNGNACLTRIGLMPLFRFQLGAREHGRAKPDASIFHAACARLGCAPHEVLHVGDDVEMDVLGAHRAGLRSVWLNRERRAWPHAQPRPDLEFHSLAALADWLDAHLLPHAKTA